MMLPNTPERTAFSNFTELRTPEVREIRFPRTRLYSRTARSPSPITDPRAVSTVPQPCNASDQENRRGDARKHRERRRGGRERDEAEECAPHLPRLVEAGEGLVGGFDAEELAERCPALSHVEDQQPFRRSWPCVSTPIPTATRLLTKFPRRSVVASRTR